MGKMGYREVGWKGKGRRKPWGKGSGKERLRLTDIQRGLEAHGNDETKNERKNLRKNHRELTHSLFTGQLCFLGL